MPQDPFGALELMPLHSGLFLKAHHSPNHLVEERGAANLGLFGCWEWQEVSSYPQLTGRPEFNNTVQTNWPSYMGKHIRD